VQSTYFLEGNGCLAPFTYPVISKLRQHSANPSTAVLDAILPAVPGVSIGDQFAMRNHVTRAFQPGLSWFLTTFTEGVAGARNSRSTPFITDLQLFKAARHLNIEPIQSVHDLQTDLAVANLTELDALGIQALVNELPARNLRAAAFAMPVEQAKKPAALAQFYKDNRFALPVFFAFHRLMNMFTPSSAACERVFSMLRARIDARQEQMLEDHIEASLMLRYVLQLQLALLTECRVVLCA
jgi:hypothetical protein